MKRILRLTWQRFCNLIKVPRPCNVTLREKAVAVAGRVSFTKNGGNLQVSCPVCLSVIRTSPDSDLKMTLALHLSLWHPDDVILQWEIMQHPKKSILHMPSFVVGVGIAAGLGVVFAVLSKKRGPALVSSGKFQKYSGFKRK